jgi:hypothetical protein
MGATARIALLLLLASGLNGCATGPTPQWLDARADQCMVARGYSPR